MTSQEEADELLRESQERRGRGIAPERHLDPTASVGQPKASRQVLKNLASRKIKLEKKKNLPRYVTRIRLEGGADIDSFQASPVGPRVPLPGKPGTPEFRAAYNAALVDAIAAEDDSDDWTELQRHHDAHRTKQGGSFSMKRSHLLPKGWSPAPRKTKRNVPANKGNNSTRAHDPIIGEDLQRRLALLKTEQAKFFRDGKVTVERLELGLAFLAYLMSLDVDKAPELALLFAKLERDLAAMRRQEDTVARAKQLLETYGGRLPVVTIAPPLLETYAVERLSLAPPSV